MIILIRIAVKLLRNYQAAQHAPAALSSPSPMTQAFTPNRRHGSRYL